MCVPCKIILNEENKRAARLATLLRKLALNPPANPEAADDALYALAEAEVEHILAIHKQAMEAAHRAGASPRWIELMERVFG